MRVYLGALMVAAGILGGCGGGVVGDWESVEPVIEERNKLSVAEPGTAEATIWIFRTVKGEQTAQSFIYEVEWKERREGESFSFDLTCQESPFGECEDEDDFEMDCDLADDDSQLSCDVDENPRWEKYPFAWQKLED